MVFEFWNPKNTAFLAVLVDSLLVSLTKGKPTSLAVKKRARKRGRTDCHKWRHLPWCSGFFFLMDYKAASWNTCVISCPLRNEFLVWENDICTLSCSSSSCKTFKCTEKSKNEKRDFLTRLLLLKMPRKMGKKSCNRFVQCNILNGFSAREGKVEKICFN